MPRCCGGRRGGQAGLCYPARVNACRRLAVIRPSRRILIGQLAGCALLAACSRKPGKPAPAVDLTVATDGDFLAFVPNVLMVPTGAHVRLSFHHAGKYVTQQHKWVLVLPGKAEAIDKAAARAGE